jgi:hypothetical protein
LSVCDILLLSYRGICAERKEVRTVLSTLLHQLAAGYAELYKTQKTFASLSKSKRDEFFGLRDFYRYCFTDGILLLRFLTCIDGTSFEIYMHSKKLS